MLAQQIKEELNTFKMVRSFAPSVQQGDNADIVPAGNGGPRTLEAAHTLLLIHDKHTAQNKDQHTSDFMDNILWRLSSQVALGLGLPLIGQGITKGSS